MTKSKTRSIILGVAIAAVVLLAIFAAYYYLPRGGVITELPR